MNNLQKIKALREVVRVGILTILATIDRDKRFLNMLSSSMIDVIRDANLAYGYNEQTIVFVPSPKQIQIAEHVERWLVWLRAEYTRRDVSRLFAWARGNPIWLLAQLERCDQKTINNRIDRSMAAILNEFFEQQITIEAINTQPKRSKYFPIDGFQIEKSTASDVVVIGGHAKVWIDGVGFMREGKRISDGGHKAERKELHRDRPR